MNKSIDELIQYIAKSFPFDEEHYPELKDATEQQRLNFAIRHLSLHFAKVTGKIATVAEGSDHGSSPNLEELRLSIPKALINTLRLAELVGMTESDIIKAIEDKYENKS